MKIVVIEVGEDYTDFLEAFHLPVFGDEAAMVTQAQAAAAKVGYKVMTNEKGGCCEYVPASEEYIAVTVYPDCL